MGTYSFVSAFCLLVMFILYFRTITKITKSQNRDMYIKIMITGMFYITMDMFWGFIYDDLMPISLPVQKLIYALFYASSVILAYHWFVFAEYMQNSAFYTSPVLKHLFQIPVFFVVAVSFLSIWTGSFFYIGENGEYYRGNMFIIQTVLTYGYIFYAAAKALCRLILAKNFERQNNYLTILSYLIFPIIFGVLQVFNQNMPYICIGITLASLQNFLFNIKFEQERTVSNSKIHSLTRAFIISYYVDLKTGEWQHVSSRDKKAPKKSGNFSTDMLKDFNNALKLYADGYVHEDDRDTYLSMCSLNYISQRLNKDDQPYSFIYRQIADGREKWYRMNILPASHALNGKVTHAIAAVMDVDSQVSYNMQQQQVLEEALVRAENANKAKSLFLSNMSHDIRTPMNAIIGFTNLAQSHIGDQAQVSEYLAKIASASKHLLGLINDVLDMSRIESGKIRLEESVVSLTDLVNDVHNFILPTTNEKNLSFTIHTSFTNDTVYCDKLRLNQVLINLLGNAVKFSPRYGKISLSVIQDSRAAQEGFGKYIFKVKDNGIGIKPEFLDKLFQPFEREKAIDSSGIQGSGLGLSITKSIVDLMGGKISVKSEPDKGSEFIIIITLKTHTAKEVLPGEETENQELSENEPEHPEKIFHGKKLLLVDDNEINREIANAILEDVGFIISEAETGKEAVEIIKNSAPGEFAAVLMDIQMPVMNGYEAAGAIRLLPDSDLANIPILAMTANAFEEDKKQAFESGMNGHIAKPLDVEILFATLKQILTE